MKSESGFSFAIASQPLEYDYMSKFVGAVFTFGKSKFAENAPSKFWIKKDEVLF